MRVCFALGNLTTSAAGDSLRPLLVSPPCSLLHVLTEVGGWYLEACPNGEGRSKHEDVLVKVCHITYLCTYVRMYIRMYVVFE